VTSGLLLAEGGSGSIEGRVADESGSALPGVTVEVRGASLAAALVGVTDAAGNYRGLRAQVEVYNLFDAKVSDVDDFYAPRLSGEPAGGVDDIHFHPAAPRSARFALVYGF